MVRVKCWIVWLCWILSSMGFAIIDSHLACAADAFTVAAWTFDEGKGDVTRDVSGNGHDGTLMSGAEWSEEGKTDGCIEFDGVESFVEVSHDDSLNLEAFTIEAWVNVGPKGSNHSVLHKAGPGGGTERNYESISNQGLDIYRE